VTDLRQRTDDAELIDEEEASAATHAVHPFFSVDPVSKLGDLAAAGGLQRIEMVAWRDLDHPEAGGSELHAARIAERWAAAGIDVRMVVSRAPGAPRRSSVDGYRVERPYGRYAVFPLVGPSCLLDRTDRPNATVEIWNGMPFFSPVWACGPRAVFLHHVHGDMWNSVLPPTLAAIGKFVERRLAPPFYRRTPVITLSESSRQAIVDQLKIPPGQVTVVEPGVDDRFRPGHSRCASPLVVAVGRLVPHKRFDLLIETLVIVRRQINDLRAVIAGEGAERPALEGLIAHHHAQEWIALPGRIDDDALIDLYQKAWLLLSTSAYEGWGLTITEAAACATPAVVSPISGHMDAVNDGITGYLAEPGPEMAERIARVLGQPSLMRRLRRAALQRVQNLTWDRTAVQTLLVLVNEAAVLEKGDPCPCRLCSPVNTVTGSRQR
jgi:glycosyltransferase involved in cell wall biosynthesis